MVNYFLVKDWRVNVQKDEYDKELQRLETRLALDQGIRRGWFTYTELGNLTNTLFSWNLIWPTLYEHCVKVITLFNLLVYYLTQVMRFYILAKIQKAP